MLENHVEDQFRFDGKGIIILVFFFLIGALFQFLFGYLEDEGIKIPYSVFWGSFLSFLIPVAGFSFFVVKKQTGKLLNFKIKKQTINLYLVLILMTMGMIFISNFLANLIPTDGAFKEFHQVYQKALGTLVKDRISIYLMTLILAPLFEEIIFRGIIQKGLINKGMKPVWAIVISALIFSIAHGNPWQSIAAAFSGCVLGYVYYKTNSIQCSMLMHFVNNFIAVLPFMIYGNLNDDMIDKSAARDGNMFYALVIGIVIFGISVYLLNKEIKKSQNKNLNLKK